MDAANRAFTGVGADFAQVATAVLNATPNIASIEVTTTGNPASGGSVNATMKVTGGGLNPQAVNGADVATGQAANRQRGDLAEQRRSFGGIEGMRQMDQVLAMCAMEPPVSLAVARSGVPGVGGVLVSSTYAWERTALSLPAASTALLGERAPRTATSCPFWVGKTSVPAG